MEPLESKVEEINELIENVSNSFDNLNFETFDTSFPIVLKKMKEIHAFRSQLIDEFGLENFLIYEPDLLKKAKQIQIKYDNLLESYSQEKEKLEKELAYYADKKKIANYLRY